MGKVMLGLKQHIVESEEIAKAHAKLKKMKKDTPVSYTHYKTGEKMTGRYGGLKRMGGNSYAMVHHDKSSMRVPVHHIHQTKS
jgi:hypothetical protein